MQSSETEETLRNVLILQKAQEEIKMDEKHTHRYKERIDGLLRVVASHEEQHVQDMYALVEKEYLSLNKNGISEFVADCGEYVMNIDSIYADNVNKCELDVCACIKREFRDRNIYDKNGKERFKLYWHCENEKAVVIQQFVDQ
eukprot:780417_1